MNAATGRLWAVVAAPIAAVAVGGWPMFAAVCVIVGASVLVVNSDRTTENVKKLLLQ